MATETALVPSTVDSDDDEEDEENNEPALANISPISHKKTMLVINTFVINTTEFLNKFAELCEGKLANVSQMCSRLEIQCALLEAKLNSIKYLNSNSSGGGDAPAAAIAATPAAPAGAAAPPPMGGVPPPPPPPGPPGVAAAAAAPAAVEPVPAASAPKFKDDPNYGKYFKMLNMGVPKIALAPKLLAEGLDPAMLDHDPEGPSPFGGALTPAPADGGDANTQMVIFDGDDSSEESDLDAD